MIKCDRAYKKLLRQSGCSVESGFLPLRADKNARKTTGGGLSQAPSEAPD